VAKTKETVSTSMVFECEVTDGLLDGECMNMEKCTNHLFHLISIGLHTLSKRNLCNTVVCM